jgi:hypothetical protein
MLTPEEQLELEEIQKERQALEAEQSAIDSDIVNFEQSQAEPAETQAVAQPLQSPTEPQGMFEKIGESAMGAVAPVGEYLGEVLEAGERGFEQGLTSEFADEARAQAIAAATGISYEEALEEVRAEEAALEKESPIATGVGGLLGGMAQGAALTALTGGAAAPVAAVQTAGKAAKLAKLITNTAKGIGIGAASGAAAGAGESEKSLKEQAKTGFKDAEEAAKRGALFGGALSAAGSALKGTAGAIGEKISKKIDEGELPQSFRMIRDAYRAGKGGKGFSGEASKQKYTQEAYDLAENTIKPKITESLGELRRLRDYIVENASGTADDIKTPLTILNNELKKLGSQDAESLRQTILRNYKLTAEKGYVTLADANKIAKTIADEIKPEFSANIQKAAYAAINDMKNLVRNKIPDGQAVKIISDNPDMLNMYSKYVRNISQEDLAEMLKTKGNMSAGQALKKAKEIKTTLQTMGEAFKDEDPEVINSLILDPNVKDALTKILQVSSPIKELDRKMKNILDASEIMGEITNGKSDADIVNDVVKIFKNITSQPKDSSTAFIARKKFEESIARLKQAIPEVAEEIEKRTTGLVKDLELQRYIEGAGFDQSLKESGILKKLMGDIGQTTTQAANVVGQVQSAARQGKAGPISFIPTSTILKPGVSTLSSIKDKLDFKIMQNPKNPVYKTFAGMIENAINNQDEGRRIAIMNTLMQYSTFREFLKEENVE